MDVEEERLDTPTVEVWRQTAVILQVTTSGITEYIYRLIRKKCAQPWSVMAITPSMIQPLFPVRRDASSCG